MAANATQHRSVRALCEGAIMVALAQILAYLKLYELPQGGSITLAMVPIFFFAVRWGWKKGLGCAFVFGLLQLLLDGGFAIGWQSMLGDYLIAFGVLGLAGIFHRKTLQHLCRHRGRLCGTVLGPLGGGRHHLGRIYA